MLRSVLSPFYLNWLPDEIQDISIEETTIDCSQCRMTPERRAPGEKKTYQEHLKCCTFEPYVPNFHVGAMLEEPLYSDLTNRVISEKWKRKDIVLPLGLVAGVEYQKAFVQKKKSDFGNREDLLCSYFDSKNQRCGVWRYRGAVCTSYYCTSQFGKKGEKFWKTLGEYLSILDMFVAEEVLADMGFSPRQISDQLGWLKVEDLPKATLAKSENQISSLWPDDIRVPTVFYRECFRLAQTFTQERIQESMGPIGAKKIKEMIQIWKGCVLENAQ